VAGSAQQRLELGELGDRRHPAPDPVVVELQHDVAPRHVLAARDVADPVMGEVRSDEHELARREAADDVADDESSARPLDEVELVLRVVVPLRVRPGIVVGVPADRRPRLERDHLAGGRLADQAGGGHVRGKHLHSQNAGRVPRIPQLAA